VTGKARTAFLSIVTTRKEHGFIWTFFKIGFTSIFFQKFGPFLKEEGLPQKAVLLLDSATSHPRWSMLTSD
jgi:hypothetical protein